MRTTRMTMALLGLVWGLVATTVPSWAQTTEQAEAAYERALKMVREEEYRRAAEAMRGFRQEHGEDDRVADALYWEAFALYRMGETRDLKEAADRLRMLFDQHEAKARDGDGLALAARIEKELAERGDRQAAERVARMADRLRELGRSGDDDWHEDDVRLMALDALLQMDAERALPILRSVLERRDPDSEKLRERAVFVLSQQETEETAQLLMGVVRNDPSAKVREQAIFWMGQVPGEESLNLLREVLESETDEELQAKAVFALSQHDEDQAGEILREIALDQERGDEVRGQAIFWLGQHGAAGDLEFLREVYGSLENEELKGQVLFAASQHGGSQARAWLRELALDPQEKTEIRGNAIFWLAQNDGLAVSDMRELYQTLDDTELRGQVLFAASQSDDAEVVDFLLDIARNETDPELRKNAVFWLGQVDDERVADLLMELLEQ